MRCDPYDLNDHDVSLHGVDDSPLLIEPGGSVALPVAGQGLVPKTSDEAQAPGPGKHGDLSILAALEDLDGHASRRKFLVRLPMLEDRPVPSTNRDVKPAKPNSPSVRCARRRGDTNAGADW